MKNQLTINLGVKLCKEFGIHWMVIKQPLKFKISGEFIDSGFYGMTRMDNLETFATCTDDYCVMQNFELASLMVQVVGKLKIDIKSANEINGGKVIYFKALDKVFEIGKDKVERYLTAYNGHDGKHSLTWGYMYRFMSNGNWFSTTFSNQATRHTKSIKERVLLAMQTIEKNRAKEDGVVDQFMKMAEQKAKPVDIFKIVNVLTGVNMALTPEEAKDRYTTNKINKANALNDKIMEVVRSKGSTLWSIWNGVVQYTQKTMSLKRDNGDIESKMIGAAKNADKKVLSEIAKLIK